MAIAPTTIDDETTEARATRISAGRLWLNRLFAFVVDIVVTFLILRFVRRIVGHWPPHGTLLAAALLLALLAPFVEQACVRCQERRMLRKAARDRAER